MSGGLPPTRPPTDAQIEAAARSLFDSWYEDVDGRKPTWEGREHPEYMYREYAARALEAAARASLPPQPTATAEMIVAACAAWSEQPKSKSLSHAMAAALDAALAAVLGEDVTP